MQQGILFMLHQKFYWSPITETWNKGRADRLGSIFIYSTQEIVFIYMQLLVYFMTPKEDIAL